MTPALTKSASPASRVVTAPSARKARPVKHVSHAKVAAVNAAIDALAVNAVTRAPLKATQRKVSQAVRQQHKALVLRPTPLPTMPFGLRLVPTTVSRLRARTTEAPSGHRASVVAATVMDGTAVSHVVSAQNVAQAAKRVKKERWRPSVPTLQTCSPERLQASKPT